MSLPDEAIRAFANSTIANFTGPTALLKQPPQQDETMPPPAGSSFISTGRGRGRGYVGGSSIPQWILTPMEAERRMERGEMAVNTEPILTGKKVVWA